MANVDKSGYLKYKDKSGNMVTMYPNTKVANVEGLSDQIKEAKTIDMPVAATSTDGVAYVATVPGITALTAGYSFIMIPDKISSSISTTLNVNGLGAKALRVRVSGYSGTTSSPMATDWLAPNKPVRVTYGGVGWIAEVVNSDVFVVNATINGSGITADKTPTEVKDAILSGKIAVFRANNLPLLFAEHATNTNVLSMIKFVGFTSTLDTNAPFIYYKAGCVINSSGGFWGDLTKREVPAIPRITSARNGYFLKAVYTVEADETYREMAWSPITPADIGAATMTEVNTAIQSAIQNTWEASY